MKLSVFILFTAGSFLNAVFAHAQTYHVKKVRVNVIQITGKGDNKAWKKANILTDFSYPWDKEKAPATSFSALWDGEWLYCLYHVKDDTVITLVKKNEKIEVGASDRVELFMSRDTAMTPYYCLEMDATGRVLDYRASYYRKMDYTWQWPHKQFIIKTTARKDGYIVEIAISIKSLNDLGLLQNKHLRAGLFRAECKSIRNGKADLRWISWIKPNSAKADFHIPSAFGVLVLE
jgi:cellulose/xylan binding protein with CBM9 domain